jgi:hypothetical protein
MVKGQGSKVKDNAAAANLKPETSNLKPTTCLVRIALAQLDSGPDVAANLAQCAAHMRAAAAAGAALIVFPENALFRGTDDGYRAAAQRVPGPLTEQLAALSADLLRLAALLTKKLCLFGHAVVSADYQ